MKKVLVQYVGPLMHASLGEQGDDRFVAAFEPVLMDAGRAKLLVENGGNNWEYCAPPAEAVATDDGGLDE